MDSTPVDVAAKRLRMAIVTGGITLALLIAMFVVPLEMKIPVLFIGMTSFVYAAYNLVLYRYKRRTSVASEGTATS